MLLRLVSFFYFRRAVRIGNRAHEATFVFNRCVRINPNPLY